MSLSITNPPPGIIGGEPGTKGTCPGNYARYAKFKDPSSGSYWWPRLTGTTECTITDQSPYATKVEAVESGTLMSWCGEKTVTFFTKASPTKYLFTTYFPTSNPPSYGEIVTLQVTWFIR